MKVIYIKETKRKNGIINKIIMHIKLLFNIIDSENKNGRKIYYLPIAYNNIKKRKLKKISKAIIKNLEKDETNNVVLSQYLNESLNIKNYLYSSNINILNGKFLFKCLIKEILEYISKIKKEDIRKLEVSMLINDINELNKELIVNISKEVKRLNIVTNNIGKCKRIEEYLYNEFGILLNISNNKKNSLINSSIIFNIDFPSELVNQYKIYNKAIIINILNKIKIQSKKFSGVNVNYFKINIPKKYKMDDFKNEEIYESMIYNKNLYKAREKIVKDKIKIIGLIGNNGYIKENEFIIKLDT